MAAIEFDARREREVNEKYRAWRTAQPGGTIWSDVKGGPYPDGTIYMQFPDAFVDELQTSGIAFKRCAT